MADTLDRRQQHGNDERFGFQSAAGSPWLDAAGRGRHVVAVFGDDGAFDAVEENVEDVLFVWWEFFCFGHWSVL